MPDEKIILANITDEMQTAYIDYSMSVIVSRALPDVRDGLKPVHRRVLYGMHGLGLASNKPFKKSARIVGEVMGKYHPHGDSSVYEAMVRMAQEWSLRYTLIDGQGNFGSIDGDSPAAMRYTEARMAKTAEELLVDIDKNTVDFIPNFDGSLEEPKVLPSRLPNLLLNGASGIAVGMATNMPPHNLREVINGTIAYIDNKDITLDELMAHIKAPDFPTGGIIYGYAGVKEAFKTGKGRIVIRAKTEIETISSGKEQIVVTEIPYMVNKSAMIEKTAELINEKKIEGISNIRDESDKDGMRIVYELKRDAISNVVLNNLFKNTALQSAFSINNVALVDSRPQIVNLIALIKHFVDHRHIVLIRKTKFDLAQAQKRLHILEGYLICLDNLDAVISLIRSSNDAYIAHKGLVEKFNLSDIQAKAILEMRLQRLTGLEREKIINEHKEVLALIQNLQNILENEDMRMQIIKDELREISTQYGDERKTAIELDADEITMEDMIPNEPMVITISTQGYIKRTNLVEYRTQARGGIGSKGTGAKQDDFTNHLFIASAHSYLLIFTELGKLFWKKVYSLPEAGKTAKGRAIQNLIEISANDSIRSIITAVNLTDQDYLNNNYVIMCTKQGVIKKTPLEAYSNVRNTGINAIRINDGDTLLEAKLASKESHIVMALQSGRAIRFSEHEVRPMGRFTAGVRGITVDNLNDTVVGLEVVSGTNANLLVVSENGYGKQSDINDYRITKRGGKGILTLNITPKTGKLVAIKSVTDNDELMIINKSGIVIRMKVSELRVMGRATQGVRLINLQNNDCIASVAKVENILAGSTEG
jgi:DNA gyrase subunit A